MFPFLEVESINKKSAIHTKNTTKDSQEFSDNLSENPQGFAQIFNALTQSKTKKDSTPKTHSSAIKNNELIPNKQPSNFLKILDEKYHLTKNFKDSKITNLTSAKDLLEASKLQQQNKTLRDLDQVAKNLQLNLKKISLESTLKDTDPKNTTESNLQSQFFTDPKIKPQHNKKESFIFDTILQDKSLNADNSLKVKKNKEYKKDRGTKNNPATLSSTVTSDKATKDTKDIIIPKEQLNLLNKNDEKKVESKNNSKLDPKEQISKLDSQKAEIKIESKIHQNRIKNETQESLNSQIPNKESKTELQDIKENALKTLELEPKIKMESKINSKSENKLNMIQLETAIKDNGTKNNKQKEIRQGSLNAISEELYVKNNKDIKQYQTNPLNMIQKEEVIQHISEQTNKQENFLDNLLKTNQKIQNNTKELIQQPHKEKEVRKESEKLNQEDYQHNIQTQRELRFNPQSTFSHFSDRLRDAIANYRPPVTKISLELNPQNLGSVELTIAKNGDKLSVQISSNQNALQLIMQNTQEFKNALGNLGFQNVEIDFKDNQGNSLGDSNANNPNGNQQGSHNSSQQEQQNSQNFMQNTQQNHKNSENWNENSLHIDKKAKNPYERLTTVELSFSYYA